MGCSGCEYLKAEKTGGGGLAYTVTCTKVNRQICFVKDRETFKATDERPRWCPTKEVKTHAISLDEASHVRVRPAEPDQ